MKEEIRDGILVMCNTQLFILTKNATYAIFIIDFDNEDKEIPEFLRKIQNYEEKHKNDTNAIYSYHISNISNISNLNNLSKVIEKFEIKIAKNY